MTAVDTLVPVLPLPVTVPPGSTVATLTLPLLHTPPGVASLNVVDKPSHMVVFPVISDGNALTVTVAVAVQPVGKL
jgi:hypothetical protein